MDINHLTIKELEILIDTSKKRIETLKQREDIIKKWKDAGIHYNDLKQSDKNGIHEVLFQMDIIGIGDDDKVEHYYNQLPESIKEDGQQYSFSNTVIQGLMQEWFEKNII